MSSPVSTPTACAIAFVTLWGCAGGATATPDAPVAADVAADVERDAFASVDALGDSTDAAPAVSHAPFAVSLGQGVGDAFAPLVAGQPVEIVQGPQGGIHAEIVARFTPPDGAPGQPLAPHLVATVTIDDAVVGLIDVARYAVTPEADGTCETAVVPVFFAETLASAYAGDSAVLSVTLTLGARTGRASAPVVLVDDL